MHPAPSLIAFTTLSGLGFGLLVWLGIDPTPPTGWVAFAFFTIAYVLASAGLISSTFHLGRRERALKAFSQWRSSWLSREAWAALVALLVMAIHGAGLVFASTALPVLGWLGAALSLGTVYCTAMIYAQLRSIPRWYHWSTPALFVVLAMAGGALLAGRVSEGLIGLGLAGVMQLWWWWDGDRRLARSGTNLGSATGLDRRGVVRAFEPPHTGRSYLLDEMVYVVGRKHATKLRGIAMALMVGLPVLLLLLPFGHVLAALAVLSHIAGVAVSRWLFYAEAEHVVGLYYGQRQA